MERRDGLLYDPRRHDETFYRLIKNNPFGVYIVDADFRLAEISLGAQKVFSNVEPLIGRDFAEVLRTIWREPFATEAIQLFRHTLETGEPYASPSTVERRNDIPEVQAYDWRIERIVFPSGRFGVVCYFYDLSERQDWERALRESEARFREMVDGLPLIVWVHDAEGEQELVNNTFSEFFGVTREEMKGGRWELLMHPDDADAYTAEFVSCMRERRSFHARTRVMRADGEWRWIESWGRPRVTAGGEFHGFVGTSADITDRIDTELAQREDARRKDEFLAVLGHELRNPLAPLRTALELIEHAAERPDLSARAIGVMRRQLAHLTRLVDDLLDVSRVSRGMIELRRAHIALEGVIDAAIEQVKPMIDERGHELLVERPTRGLPVFGDFDRLTQVVGNLLRNAARYSDNGGRIGVHMEASDGQAVLRVRDTGLGIPREHLQGVFDMFTQVPEHGASMGGGGLGVGLALAKQLITLHGGTIEARSEGLGHGSEFVVRLPLSIGGEKPEAPERAASNAAAAELRVLVVDDNVDAAASLAAMLELRGFLAHACHSGAAALEAIGAFRPNAVLLDIGLPGMDGYEVARRIRAGAGGKDILLIAVTGWGQAEDKQRAHAAGFDHHLTKPVDSSSVSSLIAAQCD